MTFEEFIKDRLQRPEFKKEWEALHQINSLGEALEILSHLYEEIEPTDNSLSGILRNKGIRVTEAILNNIIFYERNGVCPVYDFIIGIEDEKLQAKIAEDIERLSIEGYKLQKPKMRYIKDGIYELRTKQGTNATRIFYAFVEGNNIILTNGYVKKQQKLDEREFDKAKRYRDDYIRRNH